jgi:ketosteroid isomerase-like protein
MKVILIAIAFAVVTTGSAHASDSTDVMGVVNTMLEAFNTGDTLKLASTSAAEVFIIDEVPPYMWKGANANREWLDSYAADATKNEITNGVVTLDKVKHLWISGSDAYVVTSTNYVYDKKGKQVKQLGASFTLVLHKGADGWRITAWSWATS